MNKLEKIFIAVIGLSLFTTVPALAQQQKELVGSLPTSGCPDGPLCEREPNFASTVTMIIPVVEFTLDFIFIIIILANGYVWIKTKNDEQKIRKAKKWTLISGASLAVSLLAYFSLTFYVQYLVKTMN